jgi:hypothetical protein
MFRTIIARAFVVTAIAALPAAPSLAQSSGGSPTGGAGFSTGALYAGPRVWLGNLNGAVAFGGQIERGFTKPGAYGSGIIAGGVGVDYYTWSNRFGGIGSYKYSVVPLQLFGNYHFAIESNKKLDPYLGLAFVYSVVNASWSGAGSAASAEASSSAFAGQAGLRYFLSDKLALQGQVGFGYGTLGLGATWKM